MATIARPDPKLMAQSYNARTWPVTLDRAHLLRDALLQLRVRGYRISEHFDPALGTPGVNLGAHSIDGMHYVGIWCAQHKAWHSAAADINYGPRGASVTEQRAMDAAAAYLLSRGLRVLWGRDVYKHEDHGHADTTPVTRSQVHLYTTPAPRLPNVVWPTGYKRSLDWGSAGSDVLQLQQQLRAVVSLYWRTYLGKPDGYYGPRTARVVGAFQQARHLTRDDQAGPITLTILATAYQEKTR